LEVSSQSSIEHWFYDPNDTTGGISFFSGRHGWACDNILSHELILPSGEIITTSENDHPDLYKALKGAGSSNFGIVTSFILETLPLPNKDGLWNEMRSYSWDKVPALQSARAKWMTEGIEQDFDFGGYDVFLYAGIYDMKMVVTQHIHTNHFSKSEYPEIFKQYRGIETLPEADVRRIQPMSNITLEVAASSPHGQRNTYATFTFKQSEPLEEKLIAILEEGIEKVKGVSGIVAPMIMQPLAKNTLKLMKKHGGNILGLREEDGPLAIYIISFSWTDPADDELLFKVTRDIVERSEEAAKEAGLWHPFKYVNYAEDWQADGIYPGYGEENFKWLQELQRKYDPEQTFTKGGLCGGYFRLNEKNGMEGRVRDEL